MAGLRRRGVRGRRGKRRSVRKFNRQVGRTNARNVRGGPMRGGWRI